MTLNIACGVHSNIVTPPSVNAQTFFNDTTSPFVHSIDSFTESWAAGCPVDDYRIPNLTFTYKDPFGVQYMEIPVLDAT